MSDLEHYFKRQADTRAAVANANYANVAVDLARIRERLAECHSQSDPIRSIVENPGKTERQKILIIADYIVTGRKIND
jgi:hypothetical protein